MHSRKSREIPVFAVIALDFLLTVLVLGIFVLFQIVLPAKASAESTKAKLALAKVIENEDPQEGEAASLHGSAEDAVQKLGVEKQAELNVKLLAEETTEQVETTSDLSFEIARKKEDELSETVVETVSESVPARLVEPTPDLRTPWQKKFEEFFTDEVVQSDNSYSSPNVAITIETKTHENGSRKSVYYVADIHIGSIDCFRTYLSHGVYTYFDTEDVLEMDNAANALLAISGDFCTYQKTGFFVRNGETVKDDHSWGDVCVLYEDGTMECIINGMYAKNEDLIEKGALHIWNFGPSLLNSKGEIRYDYTVSQSVMYPNPRSAVGYYEPGHYCFVVVDGRQEGYSKGMLLNELAEIFRDLGCKCAYNLDGGGSAVMTFNHERYSHQSNGADRLLGDILLICEPED